MAIVKFGTLIVGARGTLGGATLSANQSGPYAKVWSKGTNPASTKQSIQRSIIARFAILWRSLTNAQRTAWDTYAALPAQELTNSLGETYFISGFNWYMRINSNLAQAGATSRDDPPTLGTPPAPILSDFFLKTDAAPTETRIVLDASSPNPIDYIVVRANLFNSQGVTAGYSNPKHMTTEYTTNGTPVFVAGTADASTESPGKPATNLTDGDTETEWLTTFLTITGWARITLAGAQEIVQYRWYETFSNPDEVSPENWTFEYWDGATWQTADTQVDPPFPLGVYQVFVVPFGNTRAQWRMNITKNRGATGFLGMAEFDLFQAPTGTRQIDFQSEIQSTLGTVSLGQRGFVTIQIQNRDGRRGAIATAFADAEAV